MTTTHKHLSAEEKKARIDELQSRISDAVTSFVDTRNWEAWLKFVASFHTYSWRNQILIMSQNPYAVQVASFTAWKRHKRFVRKGEKGLRIFGGREIREEDPETGEVKERVFPAHAGMSRSAGLSDIRLTGFPRTRGDEPSSYGTVIAPVRFSPHTRG